MSRRGLLIALFLSLAVNLFALGAVAGGFVMAQRLREAPVAVGAARLGQPPLWAAARELSPENRRAYRQLIRGQASGLRPGLRETRRLRADAWSRLDGDRPEPAAAKAALAQARQLELRTRAEVEDRIVDFAAGLPADERAKLVQGLTNPQRPGRR